MDFETAVRLSKEIEAAHRPPLMIAGFRRQRPYDLESWAIDVLNERTNERTTSVEKDDWESRLGGLLVATEGDQS